MIWSKEKQMPGSDIINLWKEGDEHLPEMEANDAHHSPLSNARIGYYKPLKRSVGKWCLQPTGLKFCEPDRTTCVPLLSLSGCIPLSVFSVGWWIDGGGRKLSCLQPPSAPEWIKDLILALIDRFGDIENELSWHLEISLFLKAQSRFTN